MDSRSLQSRTARGDAIIERLAAETATIAKLARPFVAAHKGYLAAVAAAAAAEAARDDALAVVDVADDGLDGSVLELADGCVTAGVGTRIRPFAAVSKYSPSTLIELAYASEVKAVRALTVALKKKKPTAALRKLIAKVEKSAKAVDVALRKLSAPQKRYADALAARDALLPGWDKALRSLRRKAAAELDSDEAGHALVAHAAEVQVARARSRKKKKAKAPRE